MQEKSELTSDIPKYAAYEGSPIHVLLNGAIAELPDLSKKYKLDNKQHPLEPINEFLTLLNKDILPKYSDGKSGFKLSAWNKLTNLPSLFKLSKLQNQVQENITNEQAHPILFDFLLLLIRLMASLPKDLSEAIPFLDPASLIPVIKGMGNYKAVELDTSKPGAFSYKVTWNGVDITSLSLVEHLPDLAQMQDNILYLQKNGSKLLYLAKKKKQIYSGEFSYEGIDQLNEANIGEHKECLLQKIKTINLSEKYLELLNAPAILQELVLKEVELIEAKVQRIQASFQALPRFELSTLLDRDQGQCIAESELQALSIENLEALILELSEKINGVHAWYSGSVETHAGLVSQLHETEQSPVKNIFSESVKEETGFNLLREKNIFERLRLPEKLFLPKDDFKPCELKPRLISKLKESDSQLKAGEQEAAERLTLMNTSLKTCYDQWFNKQKSSLEQKQEEEKTKLAPVLEDISKLEEERKAFEALQPSQTAKLSSALERIKAIQQQQPRLLAVLQAALKTITKLVPEVNSQIDPSKKLVTEMEVVIKPLQDEINSSIKILNAWPKQLETLSTALEGRKVNGLMNVELMKQRVQSLKSKIEEGENLEAQLKQSRADDETYNQTQKQSIEAIYSLFGKTKQKALWGETLETKLTEFDAHLQQTEYLLKDAGWDYFFDCVEKSKDGMKGAWGTALKNKFDEYEGSFFKKNPFALVIKAFAQLPIKGKKEHFYGVLYYMEALPTFKDKYTPEEIQVSYQNFLDRLGDLKVSVQKNLREKYQALKTKVKETNQARTTLSETIASLEKQIQAMDLERKNADLATQKTVLSVVEGLNTLNESIKKFEMDYLDAQFLTKISEFQTTIQSLNKKVEKIPNDENKALQLALDRTQERLESKVKRTRETALTDLQEKYNDIINSDLQPVLDEKGMFLKSATIDGQTTDLHNIFTECVTLHERKKQYETARVDFIRRDKNTKLGDGKSLPIATADGLESHVDAVAKHVVNQVMRFLDNIISEFKEKYEETGKRLRLKKIMQDLPTTAACKKFLELIKQPEKVEMTRLCEAALAETDLITKRYEMVYSLRKKLTDYIPTRAKKYPFKDRVTFDRSNRKNFIEKELIQGPLAHYAKTGEVEALFALIKTGVKKYPGVHLKSILCRMMVEIHQFEFDLKRTGSEKLPTPESDKLLSDFAASTSKQFPAKVSGYATALAFLRNEIDALNLYAPKSKHKTLVSDLAQALRRDLDQFVISHSSGEVDKADMTAFVDLFQAKLHSQDDVLHKDKTAWRILRKIGNALVLLLTAGTYAAYTKIRYGHVQGFFKPKEEELIRAIDNQVPGLEKNRINPTIGS